jgi:hypothetical protein
MDGVGFDVNTSGDCRCSSPRCNAYCRADRHEPWESGRRAAHTHGLIGAEYTPSSAAVTMKNIGDFKLSQEKIRKYLIDKNVDMNIDASEKEKLIAAWNAQMEVNYVKLKTATRKE